jgi:transposase
VLGLEDFVMIQALVKRGVYLCDIAEELGVHPKTVRRALDRGGPPERKRRRRGRLLAPYLASVDQLLSEGVWNAVVIWRELQAKGYTGGISILRNYIHPKRGLRTGRTTVRFETEPGRQLQTDWATIRTMIAGEDKEVHFIVNTLGFSRRFHFWCTDREDAEHTYEGVIRAFEWFGGVTSEVLVDNQKAAVIAHRRGGQVQFHPRFLDLAGHYGFVPRACRPARVQAKGKVERMIQYLRHSFFAARRFSSLEDLNDQLARWIAEVAHVRPLPGGAGDRLVREALEAERPRLLPLPEHPFGCDLVRAVVSGKTPYVHFDGNDYSIPHALVRRPLTLVASEILVRVRDGATEVARHGRSYDRGQRLEAPAHLAALAREKRRAHELRGRDRLRAACAYADALLDALARRGERLAPHTSALLRLLDQYGAPALDGALQEALARGAVSAVSGCPCRSERKRSASSAPIQPDPAAVTACR